MKKIFTRIKKIKIDKNYLYLLGIVIFIMLPFFSSFMIYSDDIYYHMANVYSLDLNFSFFDYVLSPSKFKILPVIANNYGYGVGIFYPRLSHTFMLYIYQLMKCFGVNDIINTVKLTYFLLIYCSGIFMYKFNDKIFKNKNVSLLSACIYITFPYFIIDVFLRGAIAECFLFLFIPIIFIGLYYLVKKEFFKFYIYFIVGYVGAINSHLVMSVYLTVFVIIFAIINYNKFFTKDRILAVIKAGIVIIMFVSSFVLPMLEHKLLNFYEVFRDGVMYSLKGIQSRQKSMYEFFFGDKYVVISFISLILIFIVVVNLNNKVYKGKIRFILSFFICALISYFMISEYFSWKILPELFLNIQFPWRLQLFICFFSSVIAGSFLLLFKEEHQKMIILCIVFLLLFSYSKQMSAEDFTGVVSSNDINYNYYGRGWSFEYFPVDTIKNYEYFEKRKINAIKIMDGTAEIKVVDNNTPYMKFKVVDAKNATIELPRLYYLGYTIKLDDGKKLKNMDYYKNEYGFIEIQLNNVKNGVVIVSYDGTLGNKVGNVLKVIAIIISIVYLYKKSCLYRKCHC